nr:hypothetical protein [Gammaproteobacteria bacterium]
IDEHQVSKTQTGLNHLYPLHTGHFGALNLAALLGLLSASILYMGITGIITWRYRKRVLVVNKKAL